MVNRNGIEIVPVLNSRTAFSFFTPTPLLNCRLRNRDYLDMIITMIKNVSKFIMNDESSCDYDTKDVM